MHCQLHQHTDIDGCLATHRGGALQLQAAAAGILWRPSCAQQRPAEVRTDGRGAKEGPHKLLRVRKASLIIDRGSVDATEPLHGGQDHAPLHLLAGKW